MAPEQFAGRPADARVDLFAAAALFYEMLTATSPFAGDSMMATMQAGLNTRPPALTGSPAIDTVDQIIQRAVEKQPERRYQTAHEMADDIRAAMASSGLSGDVPVARAITRLIALPFRVLRPDPETDFLAFSLADAVTTSQSHLDSPVVRASLAAAQYASETPDVKTIARDADVEVVLTGTLMRAGDQIRVNAQLVDAAGGNVLWSRGVQSALGDLFNLQDDFTQRIVESLSIPLTRREEQLLSHDVPATARVYEFYLRGNECGTDRARWLVARDLYEQCVAEDAQFAPAWAQLGRMHRFGRRASRCRTRGRPHAKGGAGLRAGARAQSPLISRAQSYAYLEVDLGRAQAAMLRLLECAKEQRADPDIFAGLVHACQYCGPLDASIAAYERARRLDSNVRTSVCHAYWLSGDFEQGLATDTGGSFMKLLVSIRRGQLAQVVDDLKRIGANPTSQYDRGWRLLLAVLEKDRAVFDAGFEAEAADLRDPEGMYYWALMAAYVGDIDWTLEMLGRAVGRGWTACVPTLGFPAFSAMPKHGTERRPRRSSAPAATACSVSRPSVSWAADCLDDLDPHAFGTDHKGDLQLLADGVRDLSGP